MGKKLDKLIDEICSEVEKTVGKRKYVETFLQGIDFNSVDEGIIDEDYYYASDRLDDVFYYYEKSLNNDEYYELYGDIFTDKVVKLLNELKKELSKFTESKKSVRNSIKESVEFDQDKDFYTARIKDSSVSFVCTPINTDGNFNGYIVFDGDDAIQYLNWKGADANDILKGIESFEDAIKRYASKSDAKIIIKYFSDKLGI